MQFNYSVKMESLNKIYRDILSLENEQIVATKIKAMSEMLRQKDAQNTLKVAIGGQYSAGKSTLIKAMTGDADIAIGQDVTTTEVKEYSWQGIKIADTPGIGAGRDENHDTLSLDFIKQADLLIYLLTIQGFDRITAHDFKHLIFDKKYLEKTMLVMNKRNMEPSENEPNWRNDIVKVLGSNELVDKLRFTIIDAEDYLQGLEDNDCDFIKESHFNEFIKKLNDFIEEKGAMGKILARANIMDDFITLGLEEMRAEEKISEFDRRLLKTISDAIHSYHKIIRDNTHAMRRELLELGERLASLLSDESMNEFKQMHGRLQIDIEEILMAKKFLDDIENLESEINLDLLDVSKSASEYECRLIGQINNFPDINISKVVNLAGIQGSISTAGSLLANVSKKGVTAFAKILKSNEFTKIGGKFVAKYAGGITKSAGFLSKAAPFIAVGLDLISAWSEEKRQSEMDDARQEIRSYLKDIADGIQPMLERIKENSIYLQFVEQQNMLIQKSNEREKLNEKRKEIFGKFTLIKSDLSLFIETFSK